MKRPILEESKKTPIEKGVYVRNLSIRILPAVALLTAMALPPVDAQSDVSLTANVPFEFVVGKTTFPAGQYQVKQAQNSVVSIRSLDGSQKTFVVTDAASTVNTQERSKLIFNHYGNEYFLWQVWTKGTNAGREVPPSRGEREGARTAQRHETAAVFAQ